MSKTLRALLWSGTLALGIQASTVLAHDLQYTTSSGQAVVIKLFYVDNKPFSFEGYEITREGDKLPYQIGRTDGQGHIAFLPDRAGKWHVKAISEDGHGLDFTITTNAAAGIEGSDKPAYERYGRIVVGIAVILGVFGLMSLYLRRKRT
jgi:nickel transport protein